jgi:hypothetical protein
VLSLTYSLLVRIRKLVINFNFYFFSDCRCMDILKRHRFTNCYILPCTLDHIARKDQGKWRGNQCYNAVDEFLDTVTAIMNSDNLGSILIHTKDMSYKDKMNSKIKDGLEHLLPEGEQIRSSISTSWMPTTSCSQ